MRSRFGSIALTAAMIVVAALLGVDIVYFISGSLEQFPTAEQEDKVRRVTAGIAILLIVIEMALWFARRRLRHAVRSARD